MKFSTHKFTCFTFWFPEIMVEKGTDHRLEVTVNFLRWGFTLGIKELA